MLIRLEPAAVVRFVLLVVVDAAEKDVARALIALGQPQRGLKEEKGYRVGKVCC
jgi:hypothetical protein